MGRFPLKIQNLAVETINKRHGRIRTLFMFKVSNSSSHHHSCYNVTDVVSIVVTQSTMMNALYAMDGSWSANPTSLA